jgi:hypothetical protein
VTDTLTDRPPESPDYEPYRDAALGFLATGMTAEIVRAHARDALYVSRTARAAGIPAQEAYTEMLAIADAIENLAEVHGLTRQKAYFLAGMDKQHGPYPGPGSLQVA